MALRAPTAGDRERWLELMADPDELRYGVPAFVVRPGTIDGLDGLVADATRLLDELAPGPLTIVGVDRPGHLLGSMSWRWGAPPPMLVADIGYSVHPDARGRGVAGRAIALVARWLLHDGDGPQLARVQLDHSVENPASCRAALRGGFEREGVRRSFLPLRDDAATDGVRRHDVCLHGTFAEGRGG